MWVLFADRGGTADALAKKIKAAGGRCCHVLAGDAFEQLSERSWIINPAEPRTFQSTAGARWMEQWQCAQRGRSLLES